MDISRQKVFQMENRLRVLEHENRTLKKEVANLQSGHKILKTLLSKSKMKL